jgi:hypothetical protein
MLYVATVHYKSPRWIEIQRSHLRRHLSVPYQTWTSLEGIDRSYCASFDRVLQQRGPHEGKLNHLALEIGQVGEDDDLIMFLDGDAFPIADPMPVIMDGLSKAPLVAVRRAENLDDPQPHPCFCVTTVRTWRSLPGDWSLGPVWAGDQGRRVSDVGANLLRALELTETPWVPLLRTNGSKLHPVFFAIYGDIVYHHGAGFRGDALSRVDLQLLKEEMGDQGSRGSALSRLRSSVAGARGRRRGRMRQRASLAERNKEKSRMIFQAIERDESGWLARVTDEADEGRAAAGGLG